MRNRKAKICCEAAKQRKYINHNQIFTKRRSSEEWWRLYHFSDQFEHFQSKRWTIDIFVVWNIVSSLLSWSTLLADRSLVSSIYRSSRWFINANGTRCDSLVNQPPTQQYFMQISSSGSSLWEVVCSIRRVSYSRLHWHDMSPMLCCDIVSPDAKIMWTKIIPKFCVYVLFRDKM